MKNIVNKDILCDTYCRSFRCSERMIKIVKRPNQKKILCRMVEGDECVGYKCKFVFCSYHPPSLDLSTGVCALKKKKTQQRTKKAPKYKNSQDPSKYRHMLNKKMRKNFKLKDYY
ncbi:MAG: hypothetical protein ACXACU_09390 [Candidatus Hodarchaeales archaeon]